MSSLPTVILDAFALMVYLEGEPGAATVRNMIVRSIHGEMKLAVSVVNLGEVYYNIARKKSLEIANDVIQRLTELPIEVVSVDWEIARAAAALKAETSIAYADCFAAALGQILNCRVVTGDKEFKKLEDKVRIEWL